MIIIAGMTGVNIESYVDSYKDEVTGLILNIQKNEFGIPITLQMQPDLLDIPQFYQVNHGNFWIASLDKKIVGSIALLDIGNNQGALRKMFVSNEYRGKEWGVGQKLLNTLLNWSKTNGFSEILLGTTEKFIAAQRFYEKNGFTELSKQALPKSFPIMDVDVKFYRFLLRQGTSENS